ncbi:MAG TPA: hypothetical protein VKD22_10595 [Ramlibacter sp.]|nr:hypothetical protein [Ramlibacter sp.]
MEYVQGRKWFGRTLSDKAARAGTRRITLTWLATLAVPLAAAAAPASRDPLHTPECLHAQARLDTALAAPDARDSARLARARREVLRVCLGRDTGTRLRSGAPYPAQAVPPAVLAVSPAEAAPPPSISPPAPPVAVQRPGMLMTCDPGGCWDSEGRRLNRIGPILTGPRGPCIRQGRLVACP